MSVDPEGFDWRSPVYRRLAAAGARFAALGDAAVAESFAEPAHEAERARRLALADLSPVGRIGFKGPSALDWLHAQGVTIGEEDNRAWRQADGALAARLAPTEAVILDSVHAPGAAARLAAAWSIDAAGSHLVHRRDAVAWFVVTGAAAAAMFAKLCAVDLRPHRFPPGGVAQSVAARLAAIIVRPPDGAADAPPAFHLLAEGASGAYLWDCLVDAMAEFDGGLIGLAAVRGIL